jgi:hypothetical protein
MHRASAQLHPAFRRLDEKVRDLARGQKPLQRLARDRRLAQALGIAIVFRMEERQVRLVDPDGVEISRRQGLEGNGRVGPGLIMRLDGAHEIVPVCRIVDESA